MFCIDQLGKYERVYPFHCSPCIQKLAQKYDRTADSVTSKSDFRLESDGSGRPSPKRQEFLQNSASVFIPAGNRQGKKKEQESVETGKLYEEIERLKVEVDRPATRFLKKRV